VITLLVAAAFMSLAFLWSGDASGAVAIAATPSPPRPAATVAPPTQPAAAPTRSPIATVTLPPFPTITLPPSTSKIGPTSTLPPFVAVTGTPAAGRIVRIVARRTILRAAPGDGALNVLRNQVLPLGDQLEITDSAGSKIKGDRRLWYRVRRLSDQVEGWIAAGSFE
jgi:hypothetical protein